MVDVEINPRRLPYIGGAIKTVYNVGQVYDIITQPCTPNPDVMIRAFFANIPMLVWSIVKPDPVDFLQERFSTGHHRKRKRRWTIEEINVEKPSRGGGYLRWASFTGSELADKIGWYMLVVDATADFAVNWTSMAYRYSGCQDPNSGYASARRTTPFESFVTPGIWQVAFTEANFTAGYYGNLANVAKLAAGARIVTGSVTLGALSSGQPAVVSRIYMLTSYGGTPTISNMELTAPGSGGARSASVATPGYNVLELPATYELYYEIASAGYIRIESAMLQVSGFTAPGIQPDP